MSDGMNTVILMNTVLGYECSVDEAITIETMMFKNMRTEIERLTAELAKVREEAKVWKDRYRKRGYVMDEHAKALERAEVAEAELAAEKKFSQDRIDDIEELHLELARYKQGVEVEGYVIGVQRDIDADLYFASGWSRELGKLRGKVRVLVMKEG